MFFLLQTTHYELLTYLRSSFLSFIKYRHLSMNSTKAENGMSINALKNEAITLYCFQVSDIHRPISVTGKKSTSEMNSITPSFISSIVSSLAIFWIAVPANNIKAIKMKFITIDRTGKWK